MGHYCPECGHVCYCGGDIDDLLFDSDKYVAQCSCCVGKSDKGYLADGMEDYDDESNTLHHS